MELASPHLKCLLMLCSDMAIRSGTARLLTPEHYDAGAKTLTFTTKYQNRQTLPVPAELAKLLDRCTKPGVPFVAQLPREDSARGRYFKYDRASIASAARQRLEAAKDAGRDNTKANAT